MINLSDVCFVIGHRDTNPDKTRTKNLFSVLGWLGDNFPQFETILIEQSEKPSWKEISAGGLNLLYKHLYNKGFFNRCWTFNTAYRMSTKKYIVCADNDIVMRPQYIVDSLNALEKYDAVNPYGYIVDLDPHETLGFHNTRIMPFTQRGGRGGTNFSGGMVMFTRQAYEKIYGWDENFRGWGGEDDVQTYKIKNMLTHIEMPFNAYHLYHSRNATTGDAAYHSHYKNNVDIINKVIKMTPVEISSYYSKAFESYGNELKYTKE
jgi:hypothetical protein